MNLDAVHSDSPIAVDRVVVFGLTPLAVAAIHQLRKIDVKVVVVPDTDSNGTLAHDLRTAGVEVPDFVRRRDEALRQALSDVPAHERVCVLALANDPVENLKTAVAAHEISRDAAVVIQTFDRAFADRLEQEGLSLDGHGPDDHLEVRRAYNEASLAAPYFVAQALRASATATMRFGEENVLVAELRVLPRSPLLGKTASEARKETGCELLARRAEHAAWDLIGEVEPPLAANDHILIGGLQEDVLAALASNVRPPMRRVRQRLSESRRRAAHRAGGAGPALRDALRRRAPVPTVLLFGFAGFFVLTVVIFAISGSWDRPVEWPYNVVRTALGEQQFSPPDVPEDQTALPLVGTAALLLGGALLAAFFAQFAAVATKRRVDPEAGAERHAENLRDHVVVGGLGELGYRIARALADAGIDTVMISPDPEDKFRAAVESFAPVLVGDIRLQENLERAGIPRARGFIACTAENFSNVEACIRAERMSRDRDHELLSVARVFQDTYAEQAARGFGIDALLGAAEVAAGPFVEAALDELATTRLDVDGLDLAGARLKWNRPLGTADAEAWRERGVRMLAYREVPVDEDNGLLHVRRPRSRASRPDLSELPAVRPARSLPKDGVAHCHSVLLVGPADAVEDLRAGLR